MERFLIKLPKKTTTQENEDKENDSVSLTQEIASTSKDAYDPKPHNPDVSEDTTDSSNDDVAEDITVGEPIKKRKYIKVRKVREEWSNDHSWLINKGGSAFCKCCQKSIQGGKKHMARHESSKFHANSVKKLQQTVPIDVYTQNPAKEKEHRMIKIAELKYAMLIAEHNLSFSLMDHLPKFIASIHPDSNIAKQVRCSRTKSTHLVKNVISSYARQELTKKLENTTFSIIIDETTDISIKKCLVLAVRYFDLDASKVKDKFFSLIQLEKADAATIYDAVVGIFNANNVPLENIIGFSSDNASVMVGDLNGVKARFKRILPHIFVMPCLSHSMHLCASKACQKLPEEVEKLCHDIYNYFGHSANRKAAFQEFQMFAQVEPHNLLRPCQTRWLSLKMVVDRLNEQWRPLQLYFQAEALENNVSTAVSILSTLRNSLFQLYYKFLSHILPVITNLNTFFQSETPRFNSFLVNIGNIYKTILKFFLKAYIVNGQDLSKIDPKHPHNFLEIDKMYFGVEVEMFITITNKNIPSEDLNTFKLKCLDFYITLCSEIKKRVNFDDDTLEALNCLNSETMFSTEQASLIPLLHRFPNLITKEEIPIINLEWRSLQEFRPQDALKIEDCLSFIRNKKNGLGEQLFPLMSKFLQKIVCLPHSSAAAERLFSQLSLIKTKYRNCLHVDTCDSLMMVKELLGSASCYDWEPPTALVTYYKN